MVNEGDDPSSHTSWNKWSDLKFGVDNRILRGMNDFARQMYYYYEMVVEWTDYFRKNLVLPDDLS